MTTPDTTAVALPRVLIVEDDPLARKILSSVLKKEGYPFDIAFNGQEAIDKYGDEFFPIIITDWMMPEMDGLELCRLIRSMKINRYIYIMIVTGQDSREDVIKGLEAGADDYITKPIYQSELRVRLKGACRILELESTLKNSLAEIHELSIRDQLTGAFNRVYMDHQLEQELIRCNRYHRPLSVLMCDLDHFKAVNDTYGHLAGDEVLRSCVTTITESLRRGIDWVARYGGEEFVIVLPETDQVGAQVLAERLRRKIATTPVNVVGCEIDITASFGSATVVPSLNKTTRFMEQVLNVADTCLYQAKNNGRNQVVTAEL
jgi:diguanylate cyclase (GGDEF)-like protein